MTTESMWAKLPIRWVHNRGLANFVGRSFKNVQTASDSIVEVMREVDDEMLRNESIAALRLYLVLCCRADYKTGLAKVTYKDLIQLAKMSRGVISRSIKRLEKEGLIQREKQALKLGSVISIQGWNEGKYAWGKVPKRWLYNGNKGRMLLLAEFNYSKASFYALKIFIAILAYRDNTRAGIATISYDKISSMTGVPRHHVADAITQLYQMDLISFRQGDYASFDAMNRTNRYLVRGLGSYWPDNTIPDSDVTTIAPLKPSKRNLQATLSFLNKDQNV